MRETKANKEETWKEERKTMQETKEKKNPNLQDKNARREKDKSKECSW